MRTSGGAALESWLNVLKHELAVALLWPALQARAFDPMAQEH